jgi:hypothetical protein
VGYPAAAAPISTRRERLKAAIGRGDVGTGYHLCPLDLPPNAPRSFANALIPDPVADEPSSGHPDIR